MNITIKLKNLIIHFLLNWKNKIKAYGIIKEVKFNVMNSVQKVLFLETKILNIKIKKKIIKKGTY